MQPFYALIHQQGIEREDMKNLSIVLFVVIGFASCKKDSTGSINKDLPFENKSIKMEVVSTVVPSQTRDLHFMNASTGVVVTYNSEIYKTTDAGLSWELKYSNGTIDQPLSDVTFIDENIGFAVGGSSSCNGSGCEPAGGIVLKTTDGGEHWNEVYHASKTEIVSIARNATGDLFIASNGTKGLILKSTDLGENWITMDSVDFNLSKVTFEASNGYCTTSNGNIMTSTDNGLNWTLTNHFNTLYSTDIAFIGELGYCIEDNSTIYKTTDGGNSWEKIQNFDHQSFVIQPVSADIWLIFGAGSYSGGDFGTYYGGIKYTVDAGKKWKKFEFNDLPEIRSASFYESMNGYALAGNQLVKVTVK